MCEKLLEKMSISIALSYHFLWRYRIPGGVALLVLYVYMFICL